VIRELIHFTTFDNAVDAFAALFQHSTTGCLDSIGGEAIESLSILDSLLIDGPEQGVRGMNTFELKF
jgi:hypothetical protein